MARDLLFYNHIKAHTGHILYYLRSGGKAILPSSVVIELTNRCNLRCSMCWWNFQDNPKEGSEELRLHEFKRLIDELATFRPKLTITGSEPFIRKDISEILKYIHKKGLRIDSIMTNGILMTEERAETVVMTNPGLVQFSIDGDEEVHDHIRGMKGAYQGAIRGIKLLKSAMKDTGISRTKIRINCVISAKNVHCLNSVAELARDLEVELQFQYLMWLSREQITAHKTFLSDRLGFNDKIIGNLYNNLHGLDLSLLDTQLQKVRKFCNQEGVPFFLLQFSDQEMIRGWYSDLSFIPRRKCLEPFLVSRISAEGNVKFCPLIDYTFGNVKDAPFKSLWNNQRALRIRSLLKKERLFPGCIRCCKL